MTFSKWNNYWTYQMPEWDNHYKEDIDIILKEIETIEVIKYLMAPEKDIWTIKYNNCEFIIASDLMYGCEIRATKEDDLASMEKLIKILDL